MLCANSKGSDQTGLSFAGHVFSIIYVCPCSIMNRTASWVCRLVLIFLFLAYTNFCFLLIVIIKKNT